MKPLSIVVIGLTITSSWGNGHAVTFRGLLSALSRRGHRVVFLERDVPWYAQNRDLPEPPYCRTILYPDLEALGNRHAAIVRDADLVIVGSYVPEGVAVGRWALSVAQGLVAFYDIDTPVTLASLERGDCAYLSPALIPLYDLYLSFTGGPTLALLEQRYGAPLARPLYCSVDPERYRPVDAPCRWDLGYLGTYSTDRQPKLDELLSRPAESLPARRFVVAGPQYPSDIGWPKNVERIEHVAPDDHADFYSRQRFTLSVTRGDMVSAGWSPSVRLFEAAACGAPIVSDWQPGLDEFFLPGREILVAASAREVVVALQDMTEETRRALGGAARARALSEHTAEHRAKELEEHYVEASARAARHGRLASGLVPQEAAVVRLAGESPR